MEYEIKPICSLVGRRVACERDVYEGSLASADAS